VHEKLHSPGTNDTTSVPESRKYWQKSTQEERGLKSLDSSKGKRLFYSILKEYLFSDFLQS